MSRSGQYPFGYLSLLDAKVGGITPTELIDRIQPVLELSPFFYAAISLTTMTSTPTTGSAVGTQSTLTVPAGQAWEVIGAMASATNGTAAASLSYRLDLAPPDASLPAVALGSQAPVAIVNAAQEFVIPWSAPPGFIIGPGTQFRARLMLGMATNVDINCRCIYRPLLI